MGGGGGGVWFFFFFFFKQKTAYEIYQCDWSSDVCSSDLKKPGKWVLIGGPPCQAYSIAGRSRNRSVLGYKAERDHRSYLYREYLKVISKFRPAVLLWRT